MMWKYQQDASTGLWGIKKAVCRKCFKNETKKKKRKTYIMEARNKDLVQYIRCVKFEDGIVFFLLKVE